MMGLKCKSVAYYCKTYPYCFSAFVLATLGFICLTVAVSNPFWLESESDTGNDFVSLGLWRVCFKRYHTITPGLPHILDGCYPLHRHKIEAARKWLQPVWFLIVQCVVTSAVFLSALCLCILGYMMFQEEIEIKLFVTAFVFVFEAISAFLAFLGASIFGTMSFEPRWINSIQPNVLSWGFGFCVLSVIFLSFTSVCLLIQTVVMRKMVMRESRGAYHIPLANRNVSY